MKKIKKIINKFAFTLVELLLGLLIFISIFTGSIKALQLIQTTQVKSEEIALATQFLSAIAERIFYNAYYVQGGFTSYQPASGAGSTKTLNIGYDTLPELEELQDGAANVVFSRCVNKSNNEINTLLKAEITLTWTSNLENKTKTQKMTTFIAD